MARLLLFAAAREAAGCSNLDVVASTAGDAIAIAVERFGLHFERVLETCAVAIGDVALPAARIAGLPVDDDTEIAILPPVSGGAVHMADVAGKPETVREAHATCTLTTRPDVRARLLCGDVAKGDAVAAAQIAGILAAKRAPDLIPLCHPVRTTSVEIQCDAEGAGAIRVRARVRGTDRTGFELEALLAASVAALTLYDMGKAEDPAIRIDDLRLLRKTGGKSGPWSAP